MAMLGNAALAMWWDMDPAMRREFEDWHSHEHYPERLAIPGFRRATRWMAVEGQGVCQVYEMESHATLSSPAYLERLNAPSPWSQKMMPHHRNMVRSQCHVLESSGGSVARHAITVRLSPVAGQEEALRGSLRTLSRDLATRPGCVGGHLLRHEAPAIAQTTEQKIRGNDRYADWVFLATGYELGALEALAANELSAPVLERGGAAPGSERALFTLAISAVAGELG